VLRETQPGAEGTKRLGTAHQSQEGCVQPSVCANDARANLAHFAIPQFAEVFPSEYRQDWKALPREIPDAFVRRFGEWCGEHGVKGKYSIVPYPACVG